jgi:hypothetical protein
MRDAQVRRAFHESVLKSANGSDDTIVINELGLKNGVIRADIAVLNGKMIGYEIKTERDTLKRLPAQVTAYSEVFDKAFIITTRKHLKQVKELIPQWWGIYEIIENACGSYSFKRRRSGSCNESQNAFTIAQLLWKAEALEIAKDLLQTNVKPTITKKEIYQTICDGCCRKELSKIVIQYLKQRDNWRPNRPLLSQNDD